MSQIIQLVKFYIKIYQEIFFLAKVKMTTSIVDPKRLVKHVRLLDDCVCAPGEDLGVRKTRITSGNFPIEVWAACDTAPLERPYLKDCNHSIIGRNESIEFPFDAVKNYSDESHMHIKRNTGDKSESPHYDENDDIWLHIPMQRCACRH